MNKLFKIEENWVVFFDLFSKNGNGDSIRPLAEELRRRRPDMKFFFCTKKKNRLTQIYMADEIIIEKTLRFKYICLKAKYIISPMGFPKIKKRKGQVFVQTWHGSSIKRSYLSRDKNNKKYQKYAKQFLKADYFCIQGEGTKEYIKETFAIPESIIFKSGYPRNDILFNASEEFKQNLKKELGLPQDKKVILYCPTWRRYDYKAKLPFNLNKMKEALNEEYVLLIRSHVGKHIWVDDKNNPIEIFDNKFSFNGGLYPEATHLYLISDIFISDYSSAIYDFAITKKPEILYLYDVDSYQKEFGLFFDMRQFSPFPKAYNEDELIDKILHMHIDEVEYNNFIKEHLEYENGNASKKIIDVLLGENI